MENLGGESGTCGDDIVTSALSIAVLSVVERNEKKDLPMRPTLIGLAIVLKASDSQNGADFAISLCGG